jgi:hypothetical protein
MDVLLPGTGVLCWACAAAEKSQAAQLKASSVWRTG